MSLKAVSISISNMGTAVLSKISLLHRHQKRDCVLQGGKLPKRKDKDSYSIRDNQGQLPTINRVRRFRSQTVTGLERRSRLEVSPPSLPPSRNVIM